MLQRRFFLIEKARDANLIGILAGTLAIEKYLDVIEYMKKIIRNAGKKFYVFAVGKLNVAKLANFPEVHFFHSSREISFIHFECCFFNMPCV
jgi:diphthamide biosynthesis protein 2